MIGSSLGLTWTVRVGLFVGVLGENAETMRISLPLNIGDSGAPIFNVQGEVIGINVTNNTSRDDLTVVRNINVITEIKETLGNMEFRNINYLSFNDIRRDILQGSMDTVNTIDEDIYERFIDESGIYNIIGLNLVSGHSRNGILSLRYENSISSLFPNEALLQTYSSMLTENQYEVRIVDDTIIATRDGIVIRLKDRFGFIIIIVEGI